MLYGRISSLKHLGSLYYSNWSFMDCEIFMTAGLIMAMKLLPKRGNMAKVLTLNKIITKTSLLVQATSSMIRLVFPF